MRQRAMGDTPRAEGASEGGRVSPLRANTEFSISVDGEVTVIEVSGGVTVVEVMVIEVSDVNTILIGLLYLEPSSMTSPDILTSF